MKCALFILIGYITCIFKCEIIEGAAGEKSEDVKITPVVDTAGSGDPPDYNMQTEVTIITSSVDPTGAAEQPDNLMQPKVTVITPAVDIISTGEPPDSNTTEVTIVTSSDNPTGAAEQPDNIMQPEVTVITPVVDTTGAGESPDNNVPLEVTITAGSAEQSDKIMQPKVVVEPTYIEGQATKKQEIQANDTGTSKIKVEDALKILHKSKKLYASESIALIKKLEWLRTISNITEIEIEHNIDPKSFDYLSDTEPSLSSSSFARRRGLEDNPDFLLLKKAILKERGQSIKFKRFPRSK